MVMTPSRLKGALLEFLVRRLLSNCGFTNTAPDNLYTYERGDLFYINGKGAAHDADVLMEPPVQMPFSYPSQVLFECKAYDKKIGLPIVRNALGLRSDINEFEIVTKDSLVARKINRRAAYAIEERKRYNYQVGVASVGEFSKPAIEFAANNKIPLLSLSWVLSQRIVDLFQSISDDDFDGLNDNDCRAVIAYLKDRENSSDRDEQHRRAKSILEEHDKINEILNSFRNVCENSYVGLIETGDLIFLFPTHENHYLNELRDRGRFWDLRARIHYYLREKSIWRLSILDDYGHENNNRTEYKFFVPQRIVSLWKKHNFDIQKALDLKGKFFSKIIIFNRPDQQNIPFFMVNIDRKWLEQLRER